jgi:type I restriction enzyme S subunit
MEVGPSCRRAEVQSIPEDWELRELGELVDFANGKAHEQNISAFGRFIVVNSKFVSTGGAVRKFSVDCFCPAKKGDVLMVMSDVPNGRALAKCYLVDCNNLYTVNQRICALRPRNVHGKFLFYRLDRNRFYLGFDDGVKQTNLRRQEVLSCPLELPKSFAEQQAIATALSDADAYIESLEQLITKKRQIKQGVMQELLTGKRRLPGFEGEWVRKRLRELAEIHSGGTPSTNDSSFWNGDIAWCTPSDITALRGSKYIAITERRISARGLAASSAEMMPEKSIVMTSRATIGECAINLVPMCTNQGFKNFIPFAGVDVEFLYYVLCAQREGFLRLSSGSTFLEISKAQLFNYEVRVPVSREEQLAISSVLADIDTELFLLADKVMKARHIKQAMMQQLLTGKIRLV